MADSITPPGTSARKPHPLGIVGAARAIGRDIKLAHTVFAMPFAILGAMLAWNRQEPARSTAIKVVLIVVCMVCARTWAMVINRIADRHIDKDNPRTASRALASGSVRTSQAAVIAAISAAVFLCACAGFYSLEANAWPIMLGVPVLAWVALYSYTKRFTALCHVFLGGALAVSPLAAAIAMDPGALATTHAVWFLSGMVLFWVAGFDIIYALQDLDYDRSVKLHSIPALLGANRALWASRVFHFLAITLLVLAWRVDARLGVIFLVGIIATGALLVTEHVVLVRKGERGLSMAFFTLNGIVSCVLGIAGTIDILL